MGPGLMFQTYLQPGTYERTIAPQPPLDRFLPPEVKVVTVDKGNGGFVEIGMMLDTTKETMSKVPVHPTFDVIRVNGVLDGFTAFLRDQTTQRVLSNVVPLSGSMVSNVTLASDHCAADVDALTNAELVLAAPQGQAIPTMVFRPQGGQLSATARYEALPDPAIVQGTVVGAGGEPVEADIEFESTGINTAGAGFPLFHTNFEYVARAPARRDGGGVSSYTVVLPRGEYRLSVRPIDQAHGVTVIASFQVKPTDPYAQAKPPIAVLDRQPLHGTAVVADGRPLAQATVEALPALCVDTSSDDACMPRANQTTTHDDGTFDMPLDPGTYVLRVRPLEGTHLPWVYSLRVIGPIPVMAGTLVVPAPIYAGFQLRDDLGNTVVNAVVRAFQPPTPSGVGSTPAFDKWIEIGRAITDSTGHYDMYLAPAAQ
jgi:hypothetical protein